MKLIDHSHLVPKVNKAWIYTSAPQYVLTALCLIKQEIRLHGVVLS